MKCAHAIDGLTVHADDDVADFHAGAFGRTRLRIVRGIEPADLDAVNVPETGDLRVVGIDLADVDA